MKSGRRGVAAATVLAAAVALGLTLRFLTPTSFPVPLVGTFDNYPRASDCSFMLLIGRRAERTSEDDPTPHRNSRIALYERRGSAWRKVEGDLPVRSMSASERVPQLDEMPPVGPMSRAFGFKSVPTGVFALTKTVWRDGKTPAFLISDWGRFDGSITLDAPQEVRRATVYPDGSPSPRIEVSPVRSTIEKRGSYLHPTHTVHWSFGDSDGCINLYRPKEPLADGESDYDRLLQWLEDRNLRPSRDSPLPLRVIEFERVSNPSGDALGEILPVRIADAGSGG